MDFWRQLDIISPHQLRAPITVIGCGGIGSPAVLALAKMGCSDLTVYDPDLVEEHNLPNQIYRMEDCGRPKVEALREVVQSFTGLEIKVKREKFVQQKPDGVVISAVDSMASRQDIWLNSLRFNPKVKLYIDARMGGEVCRLFSINPLDPEEVRGYDRSLYGDEEALEELCTAQAIIYNVFLIASLIAYQVKIYSAGEKIVRELAFDFKTLTLFHT